MSRYRLGLLRGDGIGPEIVEATLTVGRAMAQATHGSAPDIAGQGIANPVGMILSAAMLLRWLAGERQDSTPEKAADAVERAVAAAFADGVRTRDLGGAASTAEFAAAVGKRVIAA